MQQIKSIPQEKTTPRAKGFILKTEGVGVSGTKGQKIHMKRQVCDFGATGMDADNSSTRVRMLSEFYLSRLFL